MSTSPDTTHAQLFAFAELLAQPEIKLAIMRPIYLAKSAWLEHIPFAFWLTGQQQPQIFVELGAHYGSSYFAFCQAIEQLSLKTRCYAVDTWKGDEHAGFYGEEVFRAVRAHHDELYSRFSCLVRSTFDEAGEYFNEDSIDLLHIDGLHTREAVQHDFETWFPKLSDRAVVVLHDTNVRERGFGVSRFLADLSKNYPVFEFDHGHGLAIIGVGKNLQPGIRRLLELARGSDAHRDCCEFFSRLGRACADAYTVRRLNEGRPASGGAPTISGACPENSSASLPSHPLDETPPFLENGAQDPLN